MNSLDATPTEVSNSQFVYSSRITFDNDYVYLHKENNATLQRMALDGTTYEHIEFEYQNSPLLRNADGLVTGSSWDVNRCFGTLWNRSIEELMSTCNELQ